MQFECTSLPKVRLLSKLEETVRWAMVTLRMSTLVLVVSISAHGQNLGEPIISTGGMGTTPSPIFLDATQFGGWPTFTFFFVKVGTTMSGGRSAESMLCFARRMWPELLPFLPGPPLESR